MDGNRFLQLYQQTLRDEAFYDDLAKVGDAQIALADFSDDIWWNNATVSTMPDSELLNEIEGYFAKKQKTPVFYFADKSAVREELERVLNERGYVRAGYEVWLEMGKTQINTDKFSQIRKVKTPEDLEVFIETIDAGYGADDPDNPYGGLGRYLDQLRKAFTMRGKDAKIEHFVIFDETDVPVGVGSLTSFDGFGYISNIATVPWARKQGYGTAILNYLLDLSMKIGNKTHCLATEVGEYPDRLYRKIGFTEMFRAKYLVKR